MDTLSQMDERGLQQFELDPDRHPWSGSYWPYAGGILAFRYADFEGIALSKRKSISLISTIMI